MLKQPDGRFKISDVPSLTATMKMTHAELIDVLRFCPISDYFSANETHLNPQMI